jgi:hypothetical protein
MFNWLVAHVTLPYVFTLIIGLLLGYGINWFVCARKVRKNPDHPIVVKGDGLVTVVSLVIIIAVSWVMISVTQARNCAIRLNVSTSAETAAAKVERDGFQKAIVDSLSVPAEVRALPQNDPVYQQYMRPIQQEYLAQVAKANDLREHNKAVQDEARKACGQ